MSFRLVRTFGVRWPASPFILTMSLFLLSSPTGADVTSEPLPGVTVENVVATPAQKGGTSIIRFRIVNAGVDDISLQGLRSDSARSAALVLRNSLGVRRDVEMLSIQREEELDFSTSHISGELRDLQTDMVEGDYQDIELVFGRGSISVEAHIHRSASK